jgi:hypothetical protein
VSLERRYSPDEHRPLGGYLLLTGAFGALLGGGLGTARAAGRRLPAPGAGDVLLMALATQKVSRLIAKDRVTSFLRAPFTRYGGSAAPGEVAEEPRGRGLQLALGELLVCPYCVSQWVAGGLTLGLVAAPRTTRLLAGMWAAQTVADTAQLGYAALAERA